VEILLASRLAAPRYAATLIQKPQKRGGKSTGSAWAMPQQF